MHDNPLELSALPPVRQQARIRTPEDPDGTLYELAAPEDFGAITLRELGSKYAEVEALLGSDKKLTKAQDKRINLLVNQVARTLILEVPEATVAALPFVTKRALAMRFFAGMGDEMVTVLGEQGEKLLASALESYAPGSNASTAATPSGGRT